MKDVGIWFKCRGCGAPAGYFPDGRDEPQPFQVRLLGHNGDTLAEPGAELVSALNFGVAAPRFQQSPVEASAG